ncbi:hypothetical protein ACIRVK_30900 [Streptomyces sp. NPDC101152]|uniref:hypothetical protein n=1 Tax=Streptomyces sp. NPDC101152 TaxID=3366116 RepID=UPI00381E7FD5
MRRHALTLAVTLCAAASLAAAAGTPSAARTASAPAAHAPRPVLVDCTWHPDVRPTDFVLACGDGNSRLASLRWSQWGTTSARAEGVNWVNDCKPYCAAGHFHKYPVIVRLDHPRPWKKHPQVSHYGRITLQYPAGRPDSFPKTVSYPLWD